MDQPAHKQAFRACILASAIVFTINLAFINGLLRYEYIDQMASVEGSFIAFARYIRENWSDLTWIPLWFAGMPVEQVYQPGLHYTVAGLSELTSASPARVYHVWTATLYAAGPLTLLWMAWYFTKDWRYSSAAAAIYSLVSPSVFVFDNIRHDAGSVFAMRRLQNLVQYGDGPHVAALTLLPLVLIAIDWSTRGHYMRLAIASIAVAALVLTNWPGAIGMSLALLAYLIAYPHSIPRLSIVTIASTALILLVVPFEVLQNTVFQAQNSSGSFPFTAKHLLYAAVCVSILLAARLLKLASFRQFVVLFVAVTSLVTFTYHWLRIALLPQPYRFQQEWEVAVALGVALLLPARSLPLAFLALVPFGLAIRQQAERLIQPIDVTQTYEYRFAHWLDRNWVDRKLPGQRVFAPGSAALWINAWTDVPQFAGCCDAAIPTFIHRVALHTIYTGENTGYRDAATSIAWLRAYGVAAIGVSGPDGREAYKAFARPNKFEGVLPLLWQDGGDKLYRVGDGALAHALRPDELVNRTPAHGLDLDPLQPYLRALDRPPASFRWINRHEARVEALLQPAEVLSIQITYHPRWTAKVKGQPTRTRPDALGLLVIEPSCTGACTVELRY